MSKYPTNWLEIRARILERAQHRCERCGVDNHAMGYRDAEGRFWDDEAIDRLVTGDTLDYPPMRRIRIVLTIAHINDPDPMNCADDNLQALCQRCHNRLDAPMRAKNAAKTRRAKFLVATGQLEF
jgi:5-methylcytosine-specific restriction endonuclease McrA